MAPPGSVSGERPSRGRGLPVNRAPRADDLTHPVIQNGPAPQGAATQIRRGSVMHGLVVELEIAEDQADRAIEFLREVAVPMITTAGCRPSRDWCRHRLVRVVLVSRVTERTEGSDGYVTTDSRVSSRCHRRRPELPTGRRPGSARSPSLDEVKQAVEDKARELSDAPVQDFVRTPGRARRTRRAPATRRPSEPRAGGTDRPEGSHLVSCNREQEQGHGEAEAPGATRAGNKDPSARIAADTKH